MTGNELPEQYCNHISPSRIFRVNPLDHSFIRPTLLLEKRNGDVLGKLIYEELNFELVGKGVSRFSIKVHKVNDNNICEFWDQIKDLQLINWVGFKRFVVDIDTNESTETIKQINCTALEADELGQSTLRDFHVNDTAVMTVLDPDNTFQPTMLYVKDSPKISLLDRILNTKTKHWKVGHVDDYFNVNGRVYNAANLQREFTVNGKTPYDFLENEVSQECGCTFVYDTYNRLINCYNTEDCVFDTETMEVLDDIYFDLDSETFYKYENNNKVYVTGNYEYLRGIGEDTTILLTRDRLSENVTVNSDKDSIKNCFYVTGGDDVITNYVAASNASGTNYIYNFDYQYDLMSDGLVEKIKEYQEFYKQREIDFNKIGGIFVYDEDVYHDDESNCYRKINHNSDVRKADPIVIDDNIRIVDNKICVLSPYSYYENGKCYNEDDTLITKTHAYDEPGLFIKFCQANDRLAYWEHNKFPNMTVEDTTATEQLQNIKNYFRDNPLIITNNCSENSFSHVTLLLSNVCNVVVDNRYTATAIKEGSSCTQINNDPGKQTGIWNGKITIVRDTNKEDYAEEELTITVKKSQNAEQDKEYCDQKIAIALAKMDASQLPLTYNMTTEDSDDELRALFSEYNWTSVKGFRDSFSSCHDVLDELKNQMLSTDDERQEILSAAFQKAYDIYENRFNICVEYAGNVASENTSDSTYVGITEAKVIKWQSIVNDLSNDIIEFQKQLNIETFLGDEYYNEFLSFVREDEYNNGNYNSNGLDDSELLYRANELKEVAAVELKKASSIHYTIDGTINNIFNIKELELIKDDFCLFNYVRYIVDDKIYKLRLLEIKGDENSLDKLSIVFGDVVSVSSNPAQQEKDKLKNVASMSTSYSATTLQARQGSSAYTSVDKMKNEGLNSAEYIIKNSNAEIIQDDHGSLYRNMNDDSVFSMNQLRVTPAGIYLTDNAWDSTGMAIGTVIMTDPVTELKRKYFGIIADYVYGNLIAGNGLEIGNASNTIKITGDTIFMSSGTIIWGDSTGQGGVNSPRIEDIDNLSLTLTNITDDIEQLDGRIQTFTQDTDPDLDWTTEDKAKHENDIWFNTSNDKVYIYTKSGNTYSWVETNDSTLKDLATGKATIFTAKPTVKDEAGYLYRKGDLWIINNVTGETVNGTLYKDKTVLTAVIDNTTTTFKDSDWIPATTKYATDLASDSKITPTEKIQLKYTKMNIDSEYIELSGQAGKYSVSYTEYQTAYNTLNTYLNTILSNMDVTSDVNPSTYSSNFSTYYDKRDSLSTAIETARTDYADGVLNTWVNNTFTPYAQNIKQQLDGKIETYYQSNQPYSEHTNVDNKEEYNTLVGDLWYDTTNKKSFMYVKKANGNKYDYVWQENDGVPDEVYDQIDGKNTIFTSIPNQTLSDGYCYHKNDMWYLDVKGTDSDNYPVYEVGTILVATADSVTYNKTHWVKKDRYTDDSALDTFKTEYNTFKSNIQTQVDNKAETWYSSTDPSTDWDTADKRQIHVGDLWYETGTQKTYVYESGGTYKPNGGYGWRFMNVPTDVFDKIDGKSTIYITYPSDPEIGDLFIPTVDTTVDGETYQKDRIYRYCSTGFEPMDYTGDAELQAWIDSDYADMLDKIGTQIDGKARSWYQNTDPSTMWDTEENHEGDLWYNTSANSQVTSIYKNGAWLATNVPKAVFDEIDGVATIYVTYPSSPDLGDLLIPNTDITQVDVTYKARKVYRYNGTAFIEVDYTNDDELTDFLDNTYPQDLNTIGTRIDSKADTWYKTESEMTGIVNTWSTNTEKDKHVSDIWYCTAVNQNSSYMVDHTYMYSNSYVWEEINGVPQSVFDTLDGKKSIFLSAPITDIDRDGFLYHAGDIWVISSTDQTNSNTNTDSRNLAKQYAVKTILISSNDRQNTFTTADWSPATTESAEEALSDIADMCDDGKLTGVEKIQTKRRLTEIDDEKLLYQARKNAYNTNSSVATAWTTYNNSYESLKTQSVNWVLDSTVTTNISTSSFTDYFTNYYSAKETLDSALEAASKKYAEDQANNVQQNLSAFQEKVQGALTGNPSTVIGSDYIISPKIGGGYLYLCGTTARNIKYSGVGFPVSSGTKSEIDSLYPDCEENDLYINTNNQNIYKITDIISYYSNNVWYTDIIWELQENMTATCNTSVEINPSGTTIYDSQGHSTNNYIMRARYDNENIFALDMRGNLEIMASIKSGSSIYIGKNSDNTYNFTVDSNGTMVAQNAIIVGSVEADRGRVGCFTIDNYNLYTGSTATGFVGFLKPYSSSDPVIFAGSPDSGGRNNYKFGVLANGEMIATAGQVGGWDIGSTYLKIDKRNSSGIGNYTTLDSSTGDLTMSKTYVYSSELGNATQTSVLTNSDLIFTEELPMGTNGVTYGKNGITHNGTPILTINYQTISELNIGTITTSDSVSIGSSLFVNGNINLGSFSGSGYKSIYATVGSNDYSGIMFGAWNSNDGFLELATGDDGNEPIIARQYSGNPFNGGTVVRVAHILNSSGNTSFPGNLSASSATLSTSLTISGSNSIGVSIMAHGYLNSSSCVNANTTASPNCYIDSGGTFFKTSGSSKRFKKDIKTKFSDELNPDRLYDVNVYSYKFRKDYLKNEDDNRYQKDVIGFIAEDILEKYPIAAEYHIDENGEKVADDWSDRYIIPAILKLVQNQKQEIDELKHQINEIKDLLKSR